MTTPGPMPLPGIRKAHVSIDVRDIDASVGFYRLLFGAGPAKHYHDLGTVHSPLQDDAGLDSRRTRSGYAKFDLEQPPLNFVLNEMRDDAPARRGALSHLGLQVGQTRDVLAIRERLAAAGLQPRDEMQVDCCYARQDKFWLADPDGNEWEVFAVLEHLQPSQDAEAVRRCGCDAACIAAPAETAAACRA